MASLNDTAIIPHAVGWSAEAINGEWVGGRPWFLRLPRDSELVEIACAGATVEQTGASAREVPKKLFDVEGAGLDRSGGEIDLTSRGGTFGLLGLAAGNDEILVEMAQGSPEIAIKFFGELEVQLARELGAEKTSAGFRFADTSGSRFRFHFPPCRGAPRERTTSYVFDPVSRSWIEAEGSAGLDAHWEGDSLVVRLGDSVAAFGLANLLISSSGISEARAEVSDGTVRMDFTDPALVRKVVLGETKERSQRPAQPSAFNFGASVLTSSSLTIFGKLDDGAENPRAIWAELAIPGTRNFEVNSDAPVSELISGTEAKLRFRSNTGDVRTVVFREAVEAKLDKTTGILKDCVATEFDESGARLKFLVDGEEASWLVPPRLAKAMSKLAAVPDAAANFREAALSRLSVRSEIYDVTTPPLPQGLNFEAELPRSLPAVVRELRQEQVGELRQLVLRDVGQRPGMAEGDLRLLCQGIVWRCKVRELAALLSVPTGETDAELAAQWKQLENRLSAKAPTNGESGGPKISEVASRGAESIELVCWLLQAFLWGAAAGLRMDGAKVLTANLVDFLAGKRARSRNFDLQAFTSWPSASAASAAAYLYGGEIAEPELRSQLRFYFGADVEAIASLGEVKYFTPLGVISGTLRGVVKLVSPLLEMAKLTHLDAETYSAVSANAEATLLEKAVCLLCSAGENPQLWARWQELLSSGGILSVQLPWSWALLTLLRWGGQPPFANQGAFVPSTPAAPNFRQMGAFAPVTQPAPNFQQAGAFVSLAQPVPNFQQAGAFVSSAQPVPNFQQTVPSGAPLQEALPTQYAPIIPQANEARSFKTLIKLPKGEEMVVILHFNESGDDVEEVSYKVGQGDYVSVAEPGGFARFFKSGRNVLADVAKKGGNSGSFLSCLGAEIAIGHRFAKTWGKALHSRSGHARLLRKLPADLRPLVDNDLYEEYVA